MNKTAFAYAIACLPTGESYVGCTFNTKQRWMRHRYNLRRGIHHSPRLQSAWGQYGEMAFEFSVLERRDIASLPEKFLLEARWVASHGSLNAMPANEAGTRITITEAARAERSADALKRIAESPELQEFLNERGKALVDAVRSVEGRQNMRAHTARRWEDPEQRNALERGLINRWADPDARLRQAEKIRAARSAPESKANHAVKMKAAWDDPNSGMRNRKQTRWDDPEAKARQSEKMKAAHARRRAAKLAI